MLFRSPLVGADGLDPRVAVGVELVHLRRSLAVIQVLEVRQVHQGGHACTHGGRAEKRWKGEKRRQGF